MAIVERGAGGAERDGVGAGGRSPRTGVAERESRASWGCRRARVAQSRLTYRRQSDSADAFRSRAGRAAT
jgi:hypothetical protein